MTDRYAVMGNPVAHSKSPVIHAAFASQTGENLKYQTILVEEGCFPDAVKDFFSTGGKGLNITVPFKQEAFALADQLSEGASLSGAVNTLYLNESGKLIGHNTDGPGLLRDMCENNGGVIKEKQMLVLGAGGAARGILLPLILEGPASITVANRTHARAETLEDIFSSFNKVKASTFDALEGQQFDWVINATSASLHGQLPPLPDNLLADNAWCYDLMYADAVTPFNQWAIAHGADRAIDGLGMLVEQAAESFWLWRGVRPETGPVIDSLKN